MVVENKRLCFCIDKSLEIIDFHASRTQDLSGYPVIVTVAVDPLVPVGFQNMASMEQTCFRFGTDLDVCSLGEL